MRCAFYEKEVTPPLGGDLVGYFSHRYAQDVEDRLYVKAVVFADDSGETANMTALLTVDAENVDAPLRDAIAARIHALTGIPAEHVAVAATHSHYGISKGDDWADRDTEYMALFPRLAADAAVLAAKRLETCTLTYGLGREDGPVFVRDYILDDGAVVTNPGKHKDRIIRPYSDPDPDLPVLTAWNAKGERLGVIYTYALHCDTVGKLAFSGDFPAEVSHQLKARYGNNFVSVFLPGYSGDINHADFLGGTKWNHRSIGKAVAAEIIRVTEEKSSAVPDGTVAMTQRIIPIARREATAEMIDEAKWILEDRANRKKKYDMTGKGAELLLLYVEKFSGREPWENVPLQVMRIGDVWLFISPFEMYHQFSAPLKAAAPGGKWLITQHANMNGGYIPTEELVRSDAYPAMLRPGSRMEAKAGEKIVSALTEMAADLR